MRLGRAPLARWLEGSPDPTPVRDMLGSLYARASASRVRRIVAIPTGCRLIGVGGGTLGGSGKTPFAIELTRALAERGARVAFVGHSYRARPGSARFVRTTDDVTEVGDDALLAARSLAPFPVDVAVGPTRQAAIDLAASRAPCLVVDGLLQTRPRRLARSLLVLDRGVLFGNGKCPPAGDLRAPRTALLGATDAVVAIGDDLAPADDAAKSPTGDTVRFRLDGAIGPGGAALALSDLRGAAFGLLLAIARPDRVVRSLARLGVHPAVTLELGDHARPSAASLERAAARKQRVKMWLCTAKCAQSLPPEVAGAPVFALDFRLELPKGLVDWALSEGPLPNAFCPSSPGQNPW